MRGCEAADGQVDGRQQIKRVAASDDCSETIAQNINDFQPLFGFVDGIKSARKEQKRRRAILRPISVSEQLVHVDALGKVEWGGV